MVYDLDNQYDRERFEKKVEYLLNKRARVVELIERKPKRTISQNSYLHLLIGIVAIETGNTLDWVKREYFKKEVNRDLFVVECYDEILKRKAEKIRSSRDLTTDKMSTAIDRFKKWAAEGGIYLPDAENDGWAERVEAEMRKFQKYI